MVVVVGLVLLPFCDEVEVVVLSTKVVQMFRFWKL